MTPVSPDVTCSKTGLGLVRANHQTGWRVARDRFVNAGGINHVLINDRVGPDLIGAPERRGRYDTLGRTVYFADSKKTSLAETLQDLRVKKLSLVKDAEAVGLDVDEYLRRAMGEAHKRGVPGPGEVSVDWQMARSLYQVAMPAADWWVAIDTSATLNALSNLLAGAAGMVTLAEVTGDDRALTTQFAQVIRDVTLFDGSLPLGIEYPSKTGYGRCWAWWNRRADDNLTPSKNDPQLVGSFNVDGPDLAAICADWGLKCVGNGR